MGVTLLFENATSFSQKAFELKLDWSGGCNKKVLSKPKSLNWDTT